MLRRLIAILCLSILTSCGGGGGDSSSGSGPSNTGSKPPTVPASTSPALTFAPSVLRANVKPGTSATVSLQASVNDPLAFASASGGVSPVYVYIVDSKQVLTKDFSLTNLTPSLFSTTFHTAANLAVGKHTGTLQIQICKDVQCGTQYAGSPVDLPYEIQVSNYPMTSKPLSSTQASLHMGGTTSDVSIQVGTEGQAWSASSDVPWLKVPSEKQNGSGKLAVSFVSAGLQPGNYTGNVILSGVEEQSIIVPFSLTVLPTQFRLTSNVPQFNAVNGEPIEGKAISFEMDNLVPTPWTATTTAPWLLGIPLAGTTPSSVSLRPDPGPAKLASGSYFADLLLASPGINSRKINVGLTLIKPSLSAAEPFILLGGENGRDSSVKTLNFSLNTGNNAYPWVLSGLPEWATSTTTSGMVSQKGATLSLGVDFSKLPLGSSSAAATITATVNGDTVSLPITINANREQEKLLASEWGVGLSSTPTGNVTSRTIQIIHNFGTSTPWTAVSDSAWLSVTSSGTTGKSPDLLLKADPSKLADGTLSYATVSVKSNLAGVEPVAIKVAIWKDSVGAVGMTKLSANYSTIVADKIRPYIYAHNGGSSIDVYHAFSAKKIHTISNVAGSVAGMAVAPDGSRLFVLDTSNRALAVVDLSSMQVSASWKTLNTNNVATPLLAIRSNGVDFVLLGDGTAIREGNSLGNMGLNAGYAQAASMSASSDGRSVYLQDTGSSPASSKGYDLDFSAKAGGMLLAKPKPNSYSPWSGVSESNGQDIAVSFDGARLYRATGYPYRCSVVSPVTLERLGDLPGGDAYPNNVEVSNDGRVICGINGFGLSPDFWVHSANGVQISSHKIGTGGSLKPRQLVLTPDSLIVVTQTTAPTLAFVAIGL